MKKRPFVVAALFVFAVTMGMSGTSHADEKGPVYPKSSFSTDESDLWWNPNESGWGMQLVQQGSQIFATLFIYRSDGSPMWVTALLNPTGNLTWSGSLYVTSGPWFGGAFNPGAVGNRLAGTMTFSAPLVDSGTVSYSIDGIAVTKQVQRQLFSYDNYNGSYVVAANITQSSCFLSAANGNYNDALAVTVSHSATSMAMTWVFSTGLTCVYSGSYSQAGRMGRFDGTYSCSTGEVGNMAFFEMTNRIGMMSGRLSGQSTSNGCHYTGRFTGIDPGRP